MLRGLAGNSPAVMAARPICAENRPQDKKHLWVLTFAGPQKTHDMRIQVAVRDPDNFAMYTNNDHASYGVM